MKAAKIRVKQVKQKIGKSKFGGWPDLPKSISYPIHEESGVYREENSYLKFICQINLSEVEHTLPLKGMLYFFCDISNDDSLLSDYKLIHYDGSEKLQSRKVDIDPDEPFDEFSFEFSALKEKNVVINSEDDLVESDGVFDGTKLFGTPYFIEEPSDHDFENTYSNHRLLLQIASRDLDEGFTLEGSCGDNGYLYFTVPKKLKVTDNIIENALAFIQQQY